MSEDILVSTRPTELQQRLRSYVLELEPEFLDRIRDEQNQQAKVLPRTGVSSVAALFERLATPSTAQITDVIWLSLETPPAAKVLCAFGSVLDHTCSLAPNNHAHLAQVVKWVEIHSQRWSDPVHSQDVYKAISHPLDIPKLLNLVFTNADNKSKGGKSVVDSKPLRRAIVAGDPAFPTDRTSLGGAPAIISNTLSQLGITANFYAIYHSKEMEGFFCENTGWLDSNSPDLSSVPASCNGRSAHPTRYGYALAYHEGKYPDFFFGGITARQSDRHLLVLKPSFKLHESRPWNTWSIDGVDQQTSDLASYEWPNRTAFLTWGISGDHLAMTQVNAELLTSLGKTYQYVILSAPQLGDLKTDDDFQTPNMQLLFSQLQTLHKAGACIHLELSGEAVGESLTTFAKFLSATVDSVGINSDELPGYARIASQDQGCLAIEDPIKRRYAEALTLARGLGVSRLYVHGNDYDIIIRQTVDLESLRKDASGDLFAKAVVLVATILRNPLEVTSGLQLPKQMNWQTLTALDAVMNSGIGGLETPVREMAAASTDINDLHWEARTMRGTVCPRPEPDGYQAAFVPCIWLPDPPAGFSATGAGDITSGVSFVYSGFCARGG